MARPIDGPVRTGRERPADRRCVAPPASHHAEPLVVPSDAILTETRNRDGVCGRPFDATAPAFVQQDRRIAQAKPGPTEARLVEEDDRAVVGDDIEIPLDELEHGTSCARPAGTPVGDPERCGDTFSIPSREPARKHERKEPGSARWQGGAVLPTSG